MIKWTQASFIAIGLLALPAHAYKFDFNKAGVATFVHATGGSSQLGSSSVADSSGTGNTVDQTVVADFSGEAGMLFNLGRVNVILSGEFLDSKGINSANLNNQGGTQLGTVDSSVYGVLGNFGLELIFHPRPGSRLLIGSALTYGNVTYSNRYTFNAAGSAALKNISNYTEQGSGYGLGGKVYGGFEFLFTDNVTCNFDIGYRYLPISSFNHDTAETTINGAVNKGDPVTNNDGTRRKLDLSGAYIGLGFRFYFL